MCAYVNMEYMEANKQTIIKLVKDNNSHREIAKYLREAFPEVKRGFSERNVRLFCASNNIKKMKAQDVDQIVQKCVEEVSIYKSQILITMRWTCFQEKEESRKRSIFLQDFDIS